MIRKHVFTSLLAFFFVVSCKEDINMAPRRDYGEGLTDDGAVQRDLSGWSTISRMRTHGTPTAGLQVVFPEPGEHTVQFALADIFPESGSIDIPVIIEAEATVTWSVGGNDVIRRVSLGPGSGMMSVSGRGEAVRVVVNDVTSDAAPGGFGAHDHDYDVTILVCPGLRSDAQNPPTLVPRREDGIGTAVNPFTVPVGVNPATFDVPRNVGIVSVMITVGSSGVTVPDGSAYVEQLDRNLVVIKSYDARQSDWVPLAPGTYSVKVYNRLPANSIIVHCTFGIDG